MTQTANEGKLPGTGRAVAEAIAVLDKIRSCGFDVMGTRHRLTVSEKEALLRELTGQTRPTMRPQPQ